ASLASLGLVPQELSNRMAQGGNIMPFGPNSVKITMVHAEHNSELVWNNPATGKNEIHFGGEPCGFIIQLENGFKIYHMGDTGLFGDMKMIGEYYKARSRPDSDRRRPIRDESRGRGVRDAEFSQAEICAAVPLRHQSFPDGDAAGVHESARQVEHEGVSYQSRRETGVLT